MLKELLKKTDDDLVSISEQYRKYYNSNLEIFKIEYENYANTTKKELPLLVLDYIKIYQLFGYNQDELSFFIRRKIVSFYLHNISDFIKKEDGFVIYSFIDIFYCDPLFFENKETLTTFFEATYPILSLKTEDMSSFIAIACMRYIAILGSEKEGKIFLEKYLQENKNGIYIEDVKEEL
ncbi:hypothetical protein [Chryseobacterium sp. RU33C]|uniref:hypothetical protein n=1 Tax=Chryseobacterium sp. RU33C TaxID=1907398 RepID=UPI00095524FC|nr:hypothetical protein [Chryseobacterium sp. RU33C]SIQ40069.1 hypothetical protein SAMN05880573_10546 [Chryseobacterium sp. RU33C]